jgi:UDP-2,3-diacylglucosamine pyrophosphatase LpxH
MHGEKKSFLHLLDDMGKYRVLARHGHEYDVWNYEGSVNMTDGDYAQVPIGDLITTEISANIPYTILRHIGDTLPPAELDRLKTNLEEVENVRPYSAIFDWLFYQTTENKPIKDEIEEALQEIIDNFNSLQYPKRWYKRHDKWSFFTLDEADKLQAVMRMFKLLGMETAEGLMKIYSRIFGSPDTLPLDNADGKLVEGAKEFLTHQSEYRYVVMGHTHNPLQVPIRITSKGLEQVYMNSGTWRAKHIKGLGGGFITLKNLTYTIVYSEGESKKQEYETWTGTLKEKG